MQRSRGLGGYWPLGSPVTVCMWEGVWKFESREEAWLACSGTQEGWSIVSTSLPFLFLKFQRMLPEAC